MRPALSIAIAISISIVGCDDTTGVVPLAGVETAVVLNSIDLSITVFPVRSMPSMGPFPFRWQSHAMCRCSLREQASFRGAKRDYCDSR